MITPAEDHVHVVIVYDPLDTSNKVHETLEWSRDRTLADYLDGLPEGIHWGVCINANPIELDHWPATRLAPGDWITIVPIPEGGGGGGKNVLRLVAMIAVVVMASYLGPMVASSMTGLTAGDAAFLAAAGVNTGFSTISMVATGAIPATGGMLINAIPGTIA